jgi:phosphopantothenoylcysteine decarboxylase/phosphopantothenate--cysteine ligase
MIDNSQELKCNGGLEYEIEKYNETGKVEHIELCNWADKVVIAPCTANTLTKMYNGMADNFVLSFLTAFLGTYKPCYVALAMNTNMYNNRAIQATI